MSEPVVCPVCETPNEPDSTNCEVCGERLTPAEPGEELSPEENVAAAIEEEAAEIEVEPLEVEPLEVEPLEVEPLEVEIEPVEPEETELEMDPEALEEPHIEVEPLEVEPAVLYSPLDGTAYPEGTPEYEEGFGPQGEELVAQPPGDLEPEDAFGDDVAHDLEPAEGDVAVESPEDEMLPADSEVEEEEVAASIAGTSEQFQQLFQPRAQPAAHAVPLPEPGAHAEPATLTVYANRKPVLNYAIDTDETLIGRRDPVSDSYPDIDLEEVDGADVVSRKHAYVFRQNKNYTLYVVSNAGTQVNQDLLELGERRQLADGDIIVLAGAIAIKFELPS